MREHFLSLQPAQIKELNNNYKYQTQELLKKIAEGDTEAFRKFFIQYSTPIEKWVRQLVKNDLDATGVLQDVFLQIWLYRDKLTEVNDLMPWLKTVTSHQCFKYLQREKTRRNNLAAYQHSRQTGETPHRAVDQDLNYNDINKLVQQVLASLTRQQYLIYQLSRERGLSSSEIAQQLNLSSGHVRNTIAVVLAKIRETLRQHGHLFVLTSFIIFL